MEKKKICFVAQFPPPMHGLSKAVDTLYNSCLSDEFDFEKIDIKNNKQFFTTIIKLIRSKADLFYFTISQSKGGNLRDLVIMKLLRWRHKKCLVHLHGGYYRKLVDNDLPKWQCKSNYKEISKLDGVIVLGNSLRYIFEGMIEESKIFVVPNCVDDEYLMSDEDFEDKLSSVEERKVKRVLYLSNFIRSKGYPEVLEMAKLEKNRCDAGEERKFHFDFAGKFFEKSEEEYFFNFVKDNELDGYVTYHGVVGGAEKRELLKNCDVFALLTRYPKEGQPISILEAMGNGMVILTTNHAGIPDIIPHESKNLMFDKFTSKDVYDVLSSYDCYRTVMSSNLQMIKTDYMCKTYLTNMGNLFRKL